MKTILAILKTISASAAILALVTNQIDLAIFNILIAIFLSVEESNVD